MSDLQHEASNKTQTRTTWLKVAICLLVQVQTSHAADLSVLRGKLPEATTALVFVKFDPSSRKELLDLLPLNANSVDGVLQQQCKEFAEATGLNPLKAEYVVFAGNSQDESPTPVILIPVEFDVEKVRKALESAPQLEGKIKMKASNYGLVVLIGERYVVLTPDNFIIVCDKDNLKEILRRKGAPATLHPGVEGSLERDIQGNTLFARIAVPEAMREKFSSGPPRGPFSAAILSHIQTLLVTINKGRIRMLIEFDDEGAAQAAQNQVEGLIDSGKTQSEEQVRLAREASQANGPLAALDPKLVGALIGQQTSKSLLESMQPTLEGTRLAFSFDTKGESGSTLRTISFFGVLAAVTLPAMQKAAQEAQGADNAPSALPGSDE